uniref:Pseudouridine-5'-phosphatase n=1 Tax=Bombyx mori TaxID=7091 RepID=A0A8R2HLK9_BOMMO|nr:probable pseudouridine-5'-phosphatase isoform X5 [Bombyx mori]
MPCVHFLCRHRPCVAVFVNKRKKFISLHSEVLYHKIIREICEKYGKDYTKDLQTRVRIIVTLGAKRLLTHLHDYKVPMALATNSTEQAVRLHALSRPKLFGMFHHKVSVTDPEVKHGKPKPDIYLVAASRFPDKPKPIKCLVFEDSVVGVEAAIKAGMQVVMTPGPRLQREHTRHATLVIKSLLDFKPELFGLPPFDKTLNKATEITNK